MPRGTVANSAFGQRQNIQKITPDTFGMRLIFVRTTIRKMRMTTQMKARNKKHEFTLVLTGFSDLTPEVENALFESGCADATLSIRSGRPFLTFSRVAPTLKEALLSAISDVKKAGIGADILRVDNRNLVTQSEIAKKIGRTRQLVHQYATGVRGPGAFPSPVCNISDNDESPLWAWCEVAFWLCENDMISEEALRDAQILSLINDVLELNYQKTVNPKLAKEVLEVIGGG
jgi:hypothetical protein